MKQNLNRGERCTLAFTGWKNTQPGSKERGHYISAFICEADGAIRKMLPGKKLQIVDDK